MRRKILLDEHLDVRFTKPPNLLLDPAKYEVVHIDDAKLKGTDNGDLLKSAAARGFDILVTNDTAIRREQKHRMHALPVGVLVLTNGELSTINKVRQSVEKALDLLKKGQFATFETKRLPIHGIREHPRGTLEFVPDTSPRPTAQQLKEAHQLPGVITKEMSVLAAAEQKRQAAQQSLQKSKDRLDSHIKRIEQIQAKTPPDRSKAKGRAEHEL